MSEENAAVATAPTDASATEAAQPANPVLQESGAAAAPLGRNEARAAALEKYLAPPAAPAAETETSAEPAPVAETATPEPVVDAAGRAHDPATGQFLPGAENAETAPAAEAVPEGYVRLPVPDGHPLRDRGRESVTVPASEEDYHRWALNEPTRRAELKEARERAVQMEEQVLRMTAAETARRKFEETVDPSTLEAIRAVEEVNPALAALMRRGLESSLPELEQAEFQTLADARIQAEVQTEVEAFVNRTRGLARVVYADIAEQPYFPVLYQKARAAYGAEIHAREQAGQFGTQNEREFLEYLRPFVLSHAEAKGVYQQKAQAAAEAERQRVAAEAKARADAEAAEREKERLLDVTQRHADRNRLAVPSQIRSGHASTPPEQRSLQDVPIHQRKRAAREQAIARAGGL